MKLAIAFIVGSFATSTFAQYTPYRPVGELREYHLDSDVQGNAAVGTQTVFSDVVTLIDAAWLRIYFAKVQLEADSFIRITSLLDQEVQELDANGMAMWENSSAYFNGNKLLVELVAAPGTTMNRFVIDQVGLETTMPLPIAFSRICGIDTRVPSNQDWSCRLMLDGGVCTASVMNTNSCLVSAGHCMSANMVVQFQVPISNSDCTLNHPPIEDQFPITDFDFSNNGVGDDWAVMTSGMNNKGERPFDRYGVLCPIATDPPTLKKQDAAIWSYGWDSDDCTVALTQQTSNDVMTNIFPTYFEHHVDAAGGSSGAAVVGLPSLQIFGIHTHTTPAECPNFATRVDLPAFVAARDLLCPTPRFCPWDLDDSGSVGTSDLLVLFAQWGTDGPADFDGSGAVGTSDLLILFANWGPCP